MTFNPSFKNALLFFVFGFLFGLFLAFLWRQMLIPNYSAAVQIQSPKELVKEVAVAETLYAKKADTLNRHGQKPQAELNNTKAALKKANEKTEALRSQVFKLLDERFDKRQLDTVDMVCDSLTSIVPILITASQEKDSLYNSALTNLESQVQNKDSAIALQTQQYVEMKSTFTKSIEAQTQLTNENKALTKSVRRHRTKSKIVSAALFILSGAAATYFLHR